MAKVYVASSWRNRYQPETVRRLRKAGHEVYDFRNPPHGGNGFRWTDIDENARDWDFAQYTEGLQHKKAERQFQADGEGTLHHFPQNCAIYRPSISRRIRGVNH